MRPADLRTPTMTELKRVEAMAAHLSDVCLANGARRAVTISQAIYGDGSPTILIDQITGYHLVPIAQDIGAGEAKRTSAAWRVERVVSCPGNEDEAIPAADFMEPLVTCSAPEAAIAAVILDIHRFWTSDAIDTFLNEEYLGSRQAG